MLQRVSLVMGLLFAAGCSADRPTAQAVCKKIVVERSGGRDCEERSPDGLGAAAVSSYWYTLANGENAQVLQFQKASDYEATERAFDAAAVLAGPHRYGNKEALIFIQMNKGASPAEVTAARDTLNEL